MLTRITLPLCATGCRRLSHSAKEYLISEGIDQKVAQGVIDAFLPARPTVGDIKALGSQGLASLTASVEREIKSNAWSEESINIAVKVPHENLEFTITGKVGQTLYQIAKQNHDLGQYLECACSGVAACSTCHIIVEDKYFEKLPPPKEDELDMLDLAAGLTDRSRLGCQIKLTKELDGLTFSVPHEVNNLFS